MTYLYGKSYQKWNEDDILQAGRAAAFAGATVIQIPESRLQKSDIATIREFYDGFSE